MRLVAATVISFGLFFCSVAGITRPPLTSPSPQTPIATAIAGAGGCGSRAALQGSIPQWLDDAGAHNNPRGLSYVIAHPPLAAGFLFGNPLRAGHPENPANKILWAVRTPRNGPLTIDGHPLGAPAPVTHQVLADNSGPGEIYPSIVDVPTPGCWQFDLRWATSHAQVELSFVGS